MNKKVLSLAVMLLAQPAFGAVPDFENKSIQMVKQYTSLIACNLDDKYTAIPFKLDDKPSYLVMWIGDDGCAGGSGTTGTRFTVVTTIYDDTPLIMQGLTQPVSDIPIVQRMYFRAGKLVTEGLVHGPDDARCCPSVRASRVFSLTDRGFQLERPTQRSRR